MNLRLDVALRIATVATALLAFASVAVGGFLDPLFVTGILAVLLAAFFVPEGRLPSHLVAAVALVALPLLLVFFLRGLDLVVVAASFASVLLAARVLARDSVESHAQAHFISVVVLSGAAALSPDFTYLLCLIPFVFTLTAGLLLAQLHREAPEASRSLPLREILGPRFLPGVFGLTAAALATTALLFVLFPRTPLSLGFRRPGGGQSAGLSDRVQLAGFGRIKADDRVVLRVHPASGEGRARLAGLYWRAHVLGRYDGSGWSAEPVALGPSAPSLRRFYGVSLPPELALRVEVVSPLPTTVIPLPESAGEIRLTGRDARGRRGSLRSVRDAEVRSVGKPSAPWRYEVRLPRQTRPVDRQPPDRADLAVPEEDPRVIALARRLLSDAGSQAALPGYLERHLSSEYRYTLELPGADPSLAHFLLERKEGHCEYFASAMIVLLRLSGVPARMVTGFYSGAWNRQGGYRVLRQGDAHAWVEVYREGAGWLRYDPTPAEGRGTPRVGALAEQLADLWDATQERWSSLVLDYNLGDQIEIWRAMKRSSARLSSRIEGALPGPGRIVGLLLVLAGGALLAFFIRRQLRRVAREKKVPPGDARRASAVFRRVSRALRRRGLPVAITDTGEDLMARADEAWPEHPEALARLQGVIGRYEEARFGGAPLSAVAARALLRQGRGTVASLPPRQAGASDAPDEHRADRPAPPPP